MSGWTRLDPGTLRAGGIAPPIRPRLAVEVQPNGIPVLGAGMARAQPDTCTVRFGIQTTAKSPAEALCQTREATERLVQLRRGRDVSEGDLHTSRLGVFPAQALPKNGSLEPWAITGYHGNSTVALSYCSIVILSHCKWVTRARLMHC